MMAELVPKDWLLHVHCFTGKLLWMLGMLTATDSLPFARTLLSTWPNCYLGFTGVITFKNASKLHNVLCDVPLNRLLLETDGPFMAPVPHRGKVVFYLKM